MEVNMQSVRESFFYNQLLKDNKLNEGGKNAHFLVNGMHNFRIEENMKVKNNPDLYYAIDKVEVGEGNMIPLWLFGFLYWNFLNTNSKSLWQNRRNFNLWW